MSAIPESISAARQQTPARGRLRPPAWLIAGPAVLFFAVATVAMLDEIAPFVNWYYICAWYPTIVVLDVLQARWSGRYYLITRPGFAVSLLGWSAVLWFFFEVVNIRVANWYYVFLPPARTPRWLGTTVSFMTVFPAVFLAERVLASRNAFDGIRWPTFAIGRRLLGGVFLTGILFAALSLAWPRAFFPMIWGALTLLIEPLNYRLDRSRSLLADLASGRPGRLLRFLAGGLAVGFLWELYNIESRSKWIYTVPGFEDFKLFEMPLLGFLGFPVFALDCFVVYQALVLLRVAVPPDHGLRIRPGRTVAAAAVAIVFSLAALVGMDRWNTDTFRPRLAELWIVEDEAKATLENTEFGDIFVLARARPPEVARTAGVAVRTAESWINAARLATLRGIGTTNARLLWQVDVKTLDDLADSDPSRLSERLQAITDRARVATPAKVRVWTRAARRAVNVAGAPAEAG
jgi:hypothetical protein